MEYILADKQLKFVGTYTWPFEAENNCKQPFLVGKRIKLYVRNTAWKLSVFSPNTGKYGPEITSYLDSFHAV